MSTKPLPDSRLEKKPVGKSPKKGNSRSKKRGESLQGSSDIYRAMIVNLHEVIFTTDLQGHFTYINPVIEQLTGHKVDQLVGSSFERFIYPDDLPGYISSFKRSQGGHTEPYEFRIFDKDGKILNVHTSSRLIKKNGKAIGITGVMVEITELRYTEQALLEAEAKYHILIKQIPAAVYIDSIDELRSTLYISPQIEKVSGYPPAEWIADPALWGKIIHPEDRDMVLAEIQRTDRTGNQFLIEYRLINRDGHVVWVRDEAVILQDSQGKPLCWQGVMLDITEQKVAEVTLRQRVEELDAFQATVLDLAIQQDLFSLLRTIVERSITLLKAPSGFIYLYDETTNDLELIVEKGFAVTIGVRLKIGEGMAGWVAQTRQTLIVDDYSTWEGRSPIFKDIPYHAVMEVPMLFGGKLIGVLGVNDSSEIQCKFTDSEAHLLLLFAGQAASVVNDARLVQGLQSELSERKRIEDSLREAEARYRALVEQIPAIVYTDSAEQIGLTQYISPQIKTIMGYDPDEWSKNNDLWTKVIHPDDRERVLAEYYRTYETGEPFTSEYRMTSNSGQTVWVRDEAVLVGDQAGHPLFWQGILKDITDRKQAEMALEESEERYRRLFDLSPDAIAVHSGGKILLANTAAMNLVGAATPEEIIGKPMLAYVHPDYRNLVIERTRQQIVEGKVVPVTEEKFVRVDGTVIDVEVTAAPVHYRDSLVSLVIFRDISERKVAEAALKESEAKYRNVVELANDGIAIVKDGIVKYANPRLAQLAGLSLDEIIGSPLTDHVYPDELPNVLNRYTRRMAGEKVPSSYETIFFHKDKSKLHVDVNAGAIQYEGGIADLVMVRDISDRKRAQALQEAIYQIAIATETTKSLKDLFPQIHKIISSVMPSENFYITLYDEEHNILRFPYFKDKLDEPYLNEIQPGQGLTAYVLRTGKSLLCTQAVHDELERKGAVKLLGVPSAIWLGVPLVIEGKTIGVMVVQHYSDPNAYGERDQQMLEYVSTQVAIAISRKQADDAMQRQVKELTVIHNVSITSAQASSIDQLIEQVTKIIGNAIYVDDFGVALFDQELKVLRPHPSYHGESFEALAIIPLSEGIMGYVATTGEPYCAADVRNDLHYRNTVPETLSELCVPIKVGENLIGVINAESRRLNFFSEDDERLLNTIAGTLATVIEKLRLFDSEHTRRQEAETLRQVAQEVTASLDINEVIRLMLGQLKHLFAFDTAYVLLLDESGQPYLIAAMDYTNEKLTSQVPNEQLKASATLRQMAQDLNPLTISDALEHPEWNWIPGAEHVRSVLAVPLVTHQRMIGVLVADSVTPNFFSVDGVRVAQLLGQQMAIALENARLYQDALQAAERRAILHRASQEIAHASQDPEQVYTAVHRAAVQLMPAEAFVITLLDEQNQETVGVYLVDKGGRSQADRAPAGVGLSGLVISTGKPVITHDLALEPIPGSVHFGEEEEVRSVLAVPLRLGEKVTGMLSVQSYQPYAYTDDDKTLLEQLAAHAAVAIENARLYGETIHRLKELEAVNHISTALRSAQTVDDMLPSLLDETLQVLGTESGVIWLFDPANGLLKEKVTRGWFTSIQEMPVKPGEGIAGTVFKTGQVIVSKEFATDPLTLNSTRDQIPSGWGGACVPIRTVRETIGVLFVSVELPRQLQADAIHLLVTLSEMAGNAIRRADLHQQTERQLQRLASLRAVDMAINTILDLRVTLGILIDHIVSQLKVDAVNILLINPKTQTLYHAASSGFRSDTFKNTRLYIGDSLAGQAIRTRATIHIPDLRKVKTLQRAQLLTEEGFVTYFGVPLIAKGQIKGVLETFHRSSIEPDPEWRNFLETLAGQAAIAIDNSVLFEELQQTNLNLSLAYDATIEGWSKALDLRDQETEGHTLRVTEMTVQLADLLGISSTDLVQIRRGALLHDIGKMGVPDSILYKPGPLAEDEWVVMHRHPEFALDMLSPISYLRQALDIPYGHHERWDGSGYPRHLPGEQIPIAARIFAVVDVWDALISDRPYRKGFTKDAAAEFIRKNSGVLFDPRVVEAFLRMLANDHTRPVP